MNFTSEEIAWFRETNQPVAASDQSTTTHTINVEALGPSGRSPARYGYDDGEKFWGGFGPTKVNVPDYWTQRSRSAHAFENIPAARGIIRRLVTNEIATGLHLESIPNELLLGVEEESLADWAEDVENRFELWGKDPFLCDATEQASLGTMQAQARLESLTAGDCLVTLQVSGNIRIPRIRLIAGDCVQTPFFGGDYKPAPGNRIEEGVELDAQGRHVAFWVRQRDGSFKRLPAWGAKSGRRLAWLVYGTERRTGEVRGRPLLSVILQSLSELDRYKDSELRKAYLNSVLSIWIEKTQDKPGSMALGNAVGGAQRADAIGPVSSQSGPREFRSADFIPGLIIEETQTGEKIHPHTANQVVAGYADFEAAIVQGMAWALEIPPEILRLSFNSNYSASKAAENNFSVYLTKTRSWFGEQFCAPIFVEWLLSETLAGNIKAPGLLESWRDPAAYVTFGSWTASDWSGHVKPSVDPVKAQSGYDLMLAAGTITRDRVSRETSGMKFSRAVRQLRRENEALARALEPLQAIEQAAAAAKTTSIQVVPDDDDEATEEAENS